MANIDRDEKRILGGSLLALALAAGGLSAVLGVISDAHMAGIANLCGSPTGHCLACYGAVTALAVALITGGAGMSMFGSPADDLARPDPDVRALRPEAETRPNFVSL